MIALAFLWHQHQPYYPDDVTGDISLPWVRLHGVKDYYGMAMHLREFPEMKCTINLVPSLLVQLQAYTERGAEDRPLQVSRRPAADLSEEDVLYLLDNFFFADAEQMIRPLGRFYELYQRRGVGHQRVEDVRPHFDTQDLRDLQTLYNLAWIHPIAIEQDQSLQQLIAKGRHFTEAEKCVVLDKHLEILRQIIPLHRELAERGQVELTTTPFYHPIVPLLLDKKLAREALPDVDLPLHTASYPEDVDSHIRRAVELHTDLFGTPPEGMWPAEGSVCQRMIPLVAQLGFRWMATDEEILDQSTQGFISRDEVGHVRDPARMYRPFRVKEGDHQLSIVFRDHVLSDRIGFHYQRGNPRDAVADFLKHLHEIAQKVEGPEPALVSVILDGENCWEHYPGGGVEFLRTLYEKCTTTSFIQPVKFGEFLREHPPRDGLPYLFAGSWIRHNFAIWIGHEEDNTAWDLLHRTREHLRVRSEQGHVSKKKLTKAWEEIHIAEGSDWFWWYGDDHCSAQDATFDKLFRKHLQNVYLLLGDTPPPELEQPVSKAGHRVPYSLPRNFLDVKIDGRHSFFEWAGAGRYATENERGAMALVTPGPIKEVHYGFNVDTFLIRLDFDRPAAQILDDFDAVRIGFAEPNDWEIVLTKTAGYTTPDAAAALPQPEVQLCYQGKRQTIADEHRFDIAVDQILEMAFPFALLNIAADEPICFYVEVLEGGQSRDRAPREATIHLLCPSANFEQIMWQV